MAQPMISHDTRVQRPDMNPTMNSFLEGRQNIFVRVGGLRLSVSMAGRRGCGSTAETGSGFSIAEPRIVIDRRLGLIITLPIVVVIQTAREGDMG